jgi:hypothetical protein
VDDRNAVPHGRVVHEVPGGEVVGAIDDHVPAVGEDPLDVLRGQALLERHDAHVWVERFESSLCGEDLRLPEPVRGVHDLALKVRLVDDVSVHDLTSRLRRRRMGMQVSRTAPTAERVHPGDAAALFPDLRDEEMPAVA